MEEIWNLPDGWFVLHKVVEAPDNLIWWSISEDDALKLQIPYKYLSWVKGEFLDYSNNEIFLKILH